MPSGYTADIAKGITFPQFVWRCARGMGALVMMRDAPSDAPIPERFEPTDYYTKEIAKSKAKIASLKAMTTAQAEAAQRASAKTETEYSATRIKESEELQAKYEAMLESARAWKPPTPDHEGLKSLMIEQIEQSIKFDCSASYYKDRMPKMVPVEEWMGAQFQEAHRQLAYHETEQAKELDRTEGRNRWLRDLRSSVPPPSRT